MTIKVHFKAIKVYIYTITVLFVNLYKKLITISTPKFYVTEIEKGKIIFCFINA